MSNKSTIYIPKPKNLNKVSFVEGTDSKQINMQLTPVAKKVNFSINGTIQITGISGTIFPTVKAASDGTVLIPYLLFLAGYLTFNGQVNDKSAGLVCQNIPIWFLWYLEYILNDGNAPIVSDGGMAAANFAMATYTVSINFSFWFVNPRFPVSQQNFSLFRPSRYGDQPNWTITGGYLYSANYLSSSDDVATTGDETVGALLTYVLNLNIYASVILIPALKYKRTDICADWGFDYQNKTQGAAATSSNYNGVQLSSVGFQQYLFAFSTDSVNGSGTGGAGHQAYYEIGSARFGVALNGIFETDDGTDQLTYDYVSSLRTEAQSNFMSGQSVIPLGSLIIDEGGENITEWQDKTFLYPNAGAHIINANGTPATSNSSAAAGAIAGSNIRFINMVMNPSTTALNSVKLGKYAGH